MKLEVVRALGAWAPTMDALPASVLELFTAGLKEKEVLHRAHLQALLRVCAPSLLNSHRLDSGGTDTEPQVLLRLNP